jgi:PAS domain S-box-containing protein
MSTVHVLLVEDSEDDAELILRQLKQAFGTVYHERVETADKMKAALEILEWDVVIADYKLPQFDASAALSLLQKTGLDIPFIVVSGKIGEETAVELMKSGASDYIMKNKLGRLGPVVKREIAEALGRRERQQTEKSLQESEERYRSLVEASPDAIVVYKDEKLMYVNPSAIRLIGARDSSELIGKSIYDFIHPENRESIHQRTIETIEQHVILPKSEERFLRMDGTVFDGEAVAVPTMFKGLRVIQTVIRDITERKQAEKSLRESEERYRRLVEITPDAIVVYVDERIMYINPAAVKLLGAHDKSEVLGKSIFDFVHPDNHEFIRQRNIETMKYGMPLPMSEEKLIRADGTIVEIEVVAIPTTFKGIKAFQAVVHDITERKRAEQALRQSEERYRALSEAAYDMIYIVNRGDIIEYVNSSAAELFNQRPEEIVGKPRASFFPPEVSSGQLRSLQSVFETCVPMHVESKAAYNEQVIWLSTWLVPMRDDTGRVTAVMGVSRDITNRKWLEEDKQKLLIRLQEALGQVKTLGGLLPICSMCKKIRDDKGYWQQVEGYIQKHTDATFTHGVCPDCFPKLYPDFDPGKLEESKEPEEPKE